MSRTVTIVSGGMDSVTLVHWLHKTDDQILVSFDYGQRHRKELQFATGAANRFGYPHHVVDLSSITNLIGTSALTGDVAVPDGHYAEDTMKATIVPNRNMMMLSIATAIAVANGAEFVAIGVHGGDHFIYPDCRAAFIAEANEALILANEGSGFRGINAPFLHSTKADIAKLGTEMEVPWIETWSCYKGGEIHCGRCGTCVERAEAFSLAGVTDPTLYADPYFWQNAVAPH